jgi:hypothetical protein
MVRTPQAVDSCGQTPQARSEYRAWGGLPLNEAGSWSIADPDLLELCRVDVGIGSRLPHRTTPRVAVRRDADPVQVVGLERDGNIAAVQISPGEGPCGRDPVDLAFIAAALLTGGVVFMDSRIDRGIRPTPIGHATLPPRWGLQNRVPASSRSQVLPGSSGSCVVHTADRPGDRVGNAPGIGLSEACSSASVNCSDTTCPAGDSVSRLRGPAEPPAATEEATPGASTGGLAPPAASGAVMPSRSDPHPGQSASAETTSTTADAVHARRKRILLMMDPSLFLLRGSALLQMASRRLGSWPVSLPDPPVSPVGPR